MDYEKIYLEMIFDNNNQIYNYDLWRWAYSINIMKPQSIQRKIPSLLRKLKQIRKVPKDNIKSRNF